MDESQMMDKKGAQRKVIRWAPVICDIGLLI